MYHFREAIRLNRPEFWANNSALFATISPRTQSTSFPDHLILLIRLPVTSGCPQNSRDHYGDERRLMADGCTG